MKLWEWLLASNWVLSYVSPTGAPVVHPSILLARMHSREDATQVDHGAIILKSHILLRWLSSWSSYHTEGGKLFRNHQQISFSPLAFETFGPLTQAGWDFLSSLVVVLLLSQITLENLPSFFGVFPFPFSASIQFVSATHLFQNYSCRYNFFDPPIRTYTISFFPLISNAFGNEVPRAK